jgi:hypothetical protein
MSIHLSSTLVRSTRAAVTLAGLAWSASCGATAEQSGPAGDGPGTLRVVSDVNRTDTALARSSLPLRVQVLRSNGSPASGATLAFSGTGIAASPSTAVADANGMASTNVQFGQRVGPATLDITAMAPSIGESLKFTILPGNAVKVVLSWRDTSMMVGDTVRSPMHTVDAYGNERSGSASLEISRGANIAEANIARDTLVVTGRQAGRFITRVRDGGFVDSLAMTVFPAGDVAQLTSANVNAQFLLSRVDGTRARKIATLNAGYISQCAQWATSGDRVIYSPGSRGLRFATVQGSEGVLLPSVNPAGAVPSQSYPVPSADGQWVYFTWDSGYPYYTIDRSIWRVHWDGSGLQQAVPPAPDVTNYFSFSVSHDGSRIVIEVETPVYGMQLWNMETGQRTDFRKGGRQPVWGPGDSLIAYVSTGTNGAGPLHVMRPDGSGDRVIGRPDLSHYGVSWSPDGRWILAAGGAPFLQAPTFWLIDVASGEPLPLADPPPFTDLPCRSWRPQ